jgi:hypothetical protein
MSKIFEENYDSKIHVMEYKRKCEECGKTWHVLASREKTIKNNINSNSCSQASFCCNPGAQLQAKRNVEAGEGELNKLKQCPNCNSSNYKEEKLIYEKK